MSPKEHTRTSPNNTVVPIPPTSQHAPKPSSSGIPDDGRYDQETGEMVPNSKAAIVNGNPANPDELDVALFVDHTDEEYKPGSNQTVQVCDFEYPEECEKVTPYKGAPDYYDCGESDETNPKTGFKCTNITAVADEDGDLSLIDEIKSPMSMCPNNEDEVEDEIEVEDDDDADADAEEEAKNNSGSRRRLMSSARKGRRAGARSRSLRTAGLRGFGGAVQSGRRSGRGGGRGRGRR